MHACNPLPSCSHIAGNDFGCLFAYAFHIEKYDNVNDVDVLAKAVSFRA